MKIYLDHNATTPIDPKVFSAMLPYLQWEYGNPSSIHHWGRQAKVALSQARCQVAGLIKAEPEEIFFTGGGTEADSWAVQGVIKAIPKLPADKHIITTQIEHPAILKTCRYLEDEGVRVTYLPLDQYGRISLDNLEAAISDKTVLISVMLGNNEIGTLQPIARIGELAQKRGICFHCDAVQAAGKMPVSVKELGVNLLSLSAHKMYGPKGVGALYIQTGTAIKPLIYGGGQERDLRSGTENVAGVVGFGAACQLAQEELPQRQAGLEKLSAFLWEQIQSQINEVHLNGHPQERLPGTLNLSFERVLAEDLLLNLDLEGIAVSGGAACKSGAHQYSLVLQAMKLPAERLHSAIRISLGKDNTEEETRHFVRTLKTILKRLRAGMACR
ncbi:MAG: cysteine desulfurase [Candidatus Schekmanbacteria bacterium]|nr:cysteine desulfurase [Candidatus Schekmanbacteria bacterium]